MNGKLKKLKDGNGNYAYPITVSDAVFVDENTTLKTKLTQLSSGGSSSTSKYTGEKWVAFGDSITSDGLVGTKGYPYYVSQTLGTTLTNYGSSGSDTNRMYEIITGTYTGPGASAYPALDYAQFDIASIAIGTNGGVGTSTMADITGYATYTEYPATYYGNVGKSIEYILEKNPNIKIYLITPPKGERSNPNPEQMKLIPKAMKEIGEYYSIPVIDVFYGCGINYKNLTYWCPDKIHPNEAGREKIGKFVAYQMMAL